MNYESSNQYNQSSDEGIRQREGKVARAIESQTAKLPSDVFMWAAGAAMTSHASIATSTTRCQLGR